MGVSMSHVYIAFSREDQAYARQLADRLQRAGVDVWIDDRIDYGVHWWRTIADAIRACAAFVLIMSPDAEHSSWVEREIAVAQRAGKPLFPLLLRGRTLTPVITLPFTDVTAGGLPPDDFFAQLRHLAKPAGGAGRNVVPPPPDFRTRALPPDKTKLQPRRRSRRTLVLAVLVAIIVIALLMFTGSRSASGQAPALALPLDAPLSAALGPAVPLIMGLSPVVCPGEAVIRAAGLPWSALPIHPQDGLGG